jgi:hypothetical protein
VIAYCEAALEYLRHAYDPRRALFSYRTTLGPDGEVVNDFAHPQVHRYTINAYLGLAEAVRADGDVEWLGDLGECVRSYVWRHADALESPGDVGLLLVLLAAVAPDEPAVGRALERVEAAAEGRGHDMQELSWMLWGACATPGARAEALAWRIAAVMERDYVHPATGLPRHRTARYRRNIVSYGSVVYYLRATFEYHRRTGDPRARERFERGARAALALQGPQGEWPWMIDVRSGVPFDLYPVFTVHQDSMAMLWLFPARELGLPGVDAAIDASVRWNAGANQAGESLVRDEPIPWIYRSIERPEAAPRVRRYLRGLGPAARAYPPRAHAVRFNRECRSYHLGWVLFAWAGRSDFPLELAPA